MKAPAKKTIFNLILVFLLLGLLSFRLFHRTVSELGQGFSSEEKTVAFKSFVTQLRGVQKIQVAELSQQEILSEESRLKVLWNKLELPKVVVAVSVPVEYVFYVDLQKKWQIEFSENRLNVICPDLEYNTPAVDVSNLQIRYEEASLLRNEKKVADHILSKLSSYLDNRAKQNRPIVREQARKQVEQLIEAWWMQSSVSNESPDINIVFKDELSVPPSVKQ